MLSKQVNQFKYLVVSCNIMERSLTIKDYASATIAKQSARLLHTYHKNLYQTISMMQGEQIVTYDLLLQPVRITRVYRLDLAS